MIAIKGYSTDGETRTVFSIDDTLASNLDMAIKRNQTRWDYVGIITGLPGAGKSVFSTFAARYCCEWFDDKYIAFDADEFIEICDKAPEYSSVVLDESYKDLNSKAGMAGDFQKIINYLQLVRQKHLFIFLILPDFFSLNKHIAIFRSSHLYVVHVDNSDDTMVSVFDRNSKKDLYILGKQFMNYRAVKSNFHFKTPAKPSHGNIIDQEKYNERKKKHLLQQGKDQEGFTKDKAIKDRLIYFMYSNLNMKSEEIAEAGKMNLASVYNSINRTKRSIESSIPSD